MTLILKGIKSELEVKVTAEVLTGSGRPTKIPFLVTYKKNGVKATEKVMAKEPEIPRTVQDRPEYTRAVIKFQQDVLREHVLGWREVPTETGEPFEFNAENLDAMLDATEYLNALWDGFLSVSSGREALAKN